MTYFLKDGNQYTPTKESNIDIHTTLPAGNYSVQLDPKRGYILDRVEEFAREPKIYGTSPKYAARIFDTFLRRESSTGVLLEGEKGSGKTLLARSISQIGYGHGMPTLIVNSPYCGDAFNTFIQCIDQPLIVLFDEFEKVYTRNEEQPKLLTLLDGVFPTKKLFILTCNDKWRIDDHMINRPGRLFYSISFTSIEEQFIREYCEDVLIDKTHIPSIINLSKMFDKFNFDMLKAIVEEMNRYNEPLKDALQLLNIRIPRSRLIYSLQLIDPEGNPQPIRTQKIEFDPMINDVLVSMTIGNVRKGQRDTIDEYDLEELDPKPGQDSFSLFGKKYRAIKFTPQNIVNMNQAEGVVRYKNAEGYELFAEREKTHEYDYRRAL